MKTCSRCNQQKEERDFQIRRASNDGLTAACRVCLAEYDKERAGLPHRVSARRIINPQIAVENDVTQPKSGLLSATHGKEKPT